MDATIMAHASRKKFSSETCHSKCESVKNFNGFVAMRGSAHRNPQPIKMAQTTNGKTADDGQRLISDLKLSKILPGIFFKKPSSTEAYEFRQKSSYREEFSKLRTPYRPNRSKPKHSCEAGIPASKTCRALFEYLKPYHSSERGISNPKGRDSRANKSKDDTKLDKKVQFFDESFESKDSNLIINGYDFISSYEYNSRSGKEEYNFMNFTFAKKTELVATDQESNLDEGPEVSFEDFPMEIGSPTRRP